MPKLNTVYDIGAAFEAIENELISSMIRNMRRHKLEEIDEDKQWAMWQALQLKSLEKYKKDNQKKYGKQFKDINAQIKTLISLSRSEGEMAQEIAILEAIRNGFPAKRISKGATAEFFKVNDRKLETLINATMNDMQKAEIAVLRMANDQYRKVIYNAQVYANTGAGTYEKAVDMATEDFVKAGLNCVQYANGARHTLADYADMAIRTASKRAYLQGEGQKRQEWGISTVIMNKRGNPCPKCLPFVGTLCWHCCLGCCSLLRMLCRITAGSYLGKSSLSIRLRFQLRKSFQNFVDSFCQRLIADVSIFSHNLA